MNDESPPKLNEVILIPITISDFRQILGTIIRNEVQDLKKSFTRDGDSRPLRLKDAAEYLGISNATLYSYVHDGKLRPLKPGKFLLFTRESLDRYLKGEPPQAEVDPKDYLIWKKKKSFK